MSLHEFDNSINLAERFIPLLDEKYKKESRTQMLDAPDELVQEGMNAKTIHIPSITTSGLGDYDRNKGFNRGKVDIEWEAHTFTQDRGTQFMIDVADDLETINVTFANASSEFIRVEVAPEIDAYRFATMAAKAGNKKDGDLDANNVVQEIDEANEVMDNAEVPDEGRVIFANPTVWRLLKQSDLIDRQFDVQSDDESINRNVGMIEGQPIVKVPQSRFNTMIELLNVDSNDNGGFKPILADINFMIVHTGAVFPVTKLDNLRVFDPQVNQQANAWKFDYRIYHDIFVPDNKTEGIYLHTEELFEAEFTVEDDGSAVGSGEAEVTIDGIETKETDGDGKAAFDLPAGEWDYTVVWDSNTETGTITITDADVTETVNFT